MPKKAQDDVKQCTLSISGGVLNPSAKTLLDNAQPRITHLFGVPLGGAHAGEKAPVRSKLQLQKPTSAKLSLFDRIMKDDGAIPACAETLAADSNVQAHNPSPGPEPADVKQQFSPEPADVKQEVALDTATCGAEAESSGKKDDVEGGGDRKEAESASASQVATSQVESASASQVATQEYHPSEPPTQPYEGQSIAMTAAPQLEQVQSEYDGAAGEEEQEEEQVDGSEAVQDKETVQKTQGAQKRKRLQQADSSDEEEQGKGGQGAENENDAPTRELEEVEDKEKETEIEAEKEPDVDPMDWRERTKVFFGCVCSVRSVYA